MCDLVKIYSFGRIAALARNSGLLLYTEYRGRSVGNLAWWRSSASWLFGPLQRSKEIQDAGGRHPNNLKITISRQQPSDFSVFT